MHLKIVCSLIALACFDISSQAQVLVKCVDSTGKTSYSDTGCPASTASNVVQTTIIATPDVIYGTTPEVIYAPPNRRFATAPGIYEYGVAPTWQQREAAFQRRRFWRGATERAQERAIAHQQQAYPTSEARATSTANPSVKTANVAPRAGGHAGGGHR